MLSRLWNIYRVPDLRKKIAFTIFIIAHLPSRRPRPRSVRRLPGDQGPPGPGEQRRRRRTARPVRRWRDHERRDLLPRDHAVHHGVDHHAAARCRDPEAGAVAAGGPGRPEEDHAVDPLPDDRPGARAVDRLRLRVAQGQRRPARLRRVPGQGPDPALQHAACGHDRAHLDRGHRGGDVARRAHHPARDRQRHVDPDLRLGRLAPARPGFEHLDRRQSQVRRPLPSASP